ncbi:hypothetical protein BU24DRAFT_414753 [Aaosphaeria arxii CBS 175.79]|uniref:Uncharacterized protein n=1 Tax=Aaosphaeria arxii CBS 175.79 TaxID=1450172 RepID=A0A6A5X916_9PLEO|nr:uncharacterized protein BU24DRAFT_414753 [Aaosphaeria arxii CBS 175.79]KAF2009421.1 hypothetical protein BU24DRAFT_414753 [Aaosphaeria arxii CBS 175.79]
MYYFVFPNQPTHRDRPPSFTPPTSLASQATPPPSRYASLGTRPPFLVVNAPPPVTAARTCRDKAYNIGGELAGSMKGVDEGMRAKRDGSCSWSPIVRYEMEKPGRGGGEVGRWLVRGFCVGVLYLSQCSKVEGHSSSIHLWSHGLDEGLCG